MHVVFRRRAHTDWEEHGSHPRLSKIQRQNTVKGVKRLSKGHKLNEKNTTKVPAMESAQSMGKRRRYGQSCTTMRNYDLIPENGYNPKVFCSRHSLRGSKCPVIGDELLLAGTSWDCDSLLNAKSSSLSYFSHQTTWLNLPERIFLS